MISFLIVAGAGTLLVGLTLVWPLLSGDRAARGRDDVDAALFRDQLAELDRDVDRGTISAEEAEGARAEIGRRLIQATRRAKSDEGLHSAPVGVSRLVAAIALIAAPALAALIYLQVGSPGRPDSPLAERRTNALAERPNQEMAERLAEGRRPAPPKLDPEFAQLLARLEKIVESRPMDIKGRRLLARNLARSGRWVDARKAYDSLVEVLGDNATAQDHADAAEAMIFAAGGYVSPQAVGALEKALNADPSLTMARYYGAFALRQAGRPVEAVALWKALLREDQASAQPQGPEWQSALAALIKETEARALGGPTRDDVKAAETMSAAERQEMIEGKVSGLEERLTSRGGSPEEWVRLINVYIQLGKRDDARRIYTLAQEKIGEPTARAFVRERALVMGLKVE